MHERCELRVRTTHQHKHRQPRDGTKMNSAENQRAVCTKTETTEKPLRTEGILRNSSRVEELGRPTSSTHSVVWPGFKTSGDGTMPPRRGLPTTVNPFLQMWSLGSDGGVEPVSWQHDRVFGIDQQQVVN